MLVYFQMESTLPDGVPVPLHELSARQINQLDPFRSVLECIDSSRAGKAFIISIREEKKFKKS